MAHSQSAKKHLRQTKKRTATNKTQKSRMRTLVKKAASVATSGDKEAADKAVRLASSALDRAAKKNVIHKNAANETSIYRNERLER